MLLHLNSWEYLHSIQFLLQRRFLIYEIGRDMNGNFSQHFTTFGYKIFCVPITQQAMWNQNPARKSAYVRNNCNENGSSSKPGKNRKISPRVAVIIKISMLNS